MHLELFKNKILESLIFLPFAMIKKKEDGKDSFKVMLIRVKLIPDSLTHSVLLLLSFLNPNIFIMNH